MADRRTLFSLDPQDGLLYGRRLTIRHPSVATKPQLLNNPVGGPQRTNGLGTSPKPLI
jgi:hypothetical protein